jgi:hypothetical protein
LQRPHVAAIDDAGRPVDRLGAVQAPQELVVQALKDAGSLPLLEAAVGRRRRAAELARQELPGDPGHEHVDDRVERDLIVDPRPPAPLRRAFRQKLAEDLPQLVANRPDRARHRHLRVRGYVTSDFAGRR